MTETADIQSRRAELEAVIADFRVKADEDPTMAYPALAEAALELSDIYAEMGEGQIALEAAETGVVECRRLFDADPKTFVLGMASSLNSLSNRLSDLGRDDEGRAAGDEAFDYARRAMEVDSEQARFVLVSVLMNQSGRSWRGGQFLRAIEEMGTAVETFREGGEAMYSFLGVMVDALHRNALALAEAGRWEEAVEVRRMTAKVFPVEHIPAPVNHLLALTMQQAAFAISRDGRPGAALPLVEEATELARGLAEKDHEQYRLFLAQSLANLASRQHEAEAHEQALDAALEAVNVFQEVAQVDAVAAMVPLAATLGTFASILSTLGYDDQARNVLEQREQLQAALKQVEE